MPWPPVGEPAVADGVRRLIGLRRTLPQLHASRPAEVLTPRDPGVFLVLRPHPLGPMLGAYNMTPEVRTVPLPMLAEFGLDESARDHITGASVVVNGDSVVLEPYQAAWLTHP
jgi:amylosucrase